MTSGCLLQTLTNPTNTYQHSLPYLNAQWGTHPLHHFLEVMCLGTISLSGHYQPVLEGHLHTTAPLADEELSKGHRVHTAVMTCSLTACLLQSASGPARCDTFWNMIFSWGTVLPSSWIMRGSKCNPQFSSSSRACSQLPQCSKSYHSTRRVTIELP